MNGPAAARPLRVAFVVDSECWGGAEIWLAHHLRRAAAHGVEPAVVAAAPVAERFRAWLPAELVTEVPLLRFAPRAPQVAAAVRAYRPDLVHVNLVDPASNAAALAAALDVAPTTATLHLAGDTAAGPGRGALAGLYARLERLLTTSRDAAAQVGAELAEPVHGIAVVRNGVDVPHVPHGPAGALPPRVGVHCRLTGQKGVDLLLEGCRLLHDRGVPLEVLVAGAGREERALRRQARGLPASFVGWAADPRAFLRRLDVFCLPSRRDALPLSLLEALAEGLPCVATDVGDVRAVLGTVVALVRPGDPVALAVALEAVLTDPRLAALLARRGRALAERELDAETMAATTYGLLHEAVAVSTTT